MGIGEKLAKLRKQQGWSQEELADRLEVTRQSVSKWESGASTPDLDKIVKLSQIFGVSTDYLLKEAEPVSVQPLEEGRESGRRVSLQEAREFLALNQTGAARIGLGVAMCIISPVILLLLGGMAELPGAMLSESLATGLGVTVMLLVIALAVGLFITSGMKLDRFSYLEREPIWLESGGQAEAQQEKEQYEPAFKRNIVLGVMLCIVSCVPVVLAGAMSSSVLTVMNGVCLLLFIVAGGVYLFVSSGILRSGYLKLLQQEEYTREKKLENKKNDVVVSVYWCIVPAIYLGYSFLTGRWGSSWIIWPVAGVLFGAVKAIANAVRK